MQEDVYDEEKAEESIALAKRADKVVVFAGLPDSFESEGYDRKHMHLPECQNRLISEIRKVQPNTIVVLHNGAPVEMPWLRDVKGLLEAYLGGQGVGKAVVRLLYGEVNPSGKLAETMPLKLSDNPSYLNFGEGEKTNYNEGVFVGYRYYDTKEMDVAFPFGYGLSYTTFEYSNLVIDKTECYDTDILTVSLDITNTGEAAGKEIVQLYVQDLTKAVRRPEKELKGYEKVYLKAGETKTVSMTLDKRSFAWYNTSIHDWYAASGTYNILIGASSRDIRLSEKVHMTATMKLPLKLHMNSTLGELMADERSCGFGKEMKRKMDSIFQEEDKPANDEAVKDEMADAVVNSMPIRNVLTFGLITKEELEEKLQELNKK